MTETALAYLYRGVKTRLIGDGMEPFERRVYPHRAPAKADFPYLIYFWQGGGERNAVQVDDAEVVLVIKAVSPDLATAFLCAAHIDARLNNKGRQDSPSDYIQGGDEWDITAVTREDDVQYLEEFAGAVPLWHCGARYRFIMEVV